MVTQYDKGGTRNKKGKRGAEIKTRKKMELSFFFFLVLRDSKLLEICFTMKLGIGQILSRLDNAIGESE